MNAATPSAKAPFAGKLFDAFLFDMDGTLLTSIEASQRVWGRWAARFGLDAAAFLAQSHGMRVREVIERLALPGVDAATETDTIMREELADMAGVREVPGAAAFLASLPPTRWAVVTSAPRRLARRRLGVAGLPTPPLLIAAEDIDRGKPDPACYLLAADRLHVAPEDCLVFEDAPAGIMAGEAARADVLVITSAHPKPVPTAHATARDYTRLAIIRDARRQKIGITGLS